MSWTWGRPGNRGEVSIVHNVYTYLIYYSLVTNAPTQISASFQLCKSEKVQGANWSQVRNIGHQCCCYYQGLHLGHPQHASSPIPLLVIPWIAPLHHLTFNGRVSREFWDMHSTCWPVSLKHMMEAWLSIRPITMDYERLWTNPVPVGLDIQYTSIFCPKCQN